MTELGSGQPAPRQTRRAAPMPLYDERHEHDACGVGFVADAGGRSRERILPLALAGLAALGHRGAFAADGESSDGAGVLIPLDPSVVALLDPRGTAGDRPGVVSVFLPRGRTGAAWAREAVETALAAEGLTLGAWRRVPADLSALGTEARASVPAFAQALVRRPDGEAGRDDAFELALICARRRAEAAARAAGRPELSIASASHRTLVYKGLVAGGRLATLFPDLAAAISVPFAMFHQRYATNTHPVWALAQPFARIAHNGEIDTVRGGREAVRGRAADRGIPSRRSGAARRLLAAGPLLSPGGSDSRSLDEALELLVATGWSLESALLALVPEAQALRRAPHPLVASFGRRTAGFLAPWDGPAALVFADGRRVGALLDRNGLRPAAFAVTKDKVVALASEAGAVPLAPGEIVRAGRLAPGELLLVDPAARRVLEDADAKAFVLRRLPVHDEPRASYVDRPERIAPASSGPGAADGSSGEAAPATGAAERYLFGVDAERLRQDVRTMAVEAHEPLWSMGDDTPLTGRARVDRPVSDHLRQSFAQVTNPPIDPERERVVLDLRVELGRRPALLGGMPEGPTTLRLERPVIADLDALRVAFCQAVAAHPGLGPGSTPGPETILALDATWPGDEGPGALERALERLATEALEAAIRGRTHVLVLTDAAASPLTGRLPVPAPLAAGAVHTALTNAGLRGRTDVVVDSGEVLDVHGVAMALASGATAVHPRLLVELTVEQAGTRGAEELGPGDVVGNLLAALDAGLRKILARMGISTMASYVGGQLFETLELGPSLVARCFPAAAAWPGRLEAADLARGQLRRLAATRALPEAVRADRLPDPGLTRYRADGEFHLFSRPAALEIQALAGDAGNPGEALDRYRAALRREPAVIRDGWKVVRPRGSGPIPVALVEPASAIARRFVVSAMSVGALSPEAHRALTLGIQAIGGSANTGEGGEDPAWYEPGPDGTAHDAKIKQVASARFGVTAQYLARAEQLEIKIAQGSKPGEGGQLPGRKATAYIASLRRAQPGQSLISPPPHHDIYSIEDLAQLIADLRAINPRARIGVKLVATRGVGTIAAGVAKAGADYVHLSGHSGGTGASPLSSIKHVGAPWELGLSEVHQLLLRNDLRDRVALRTDGGLQTGRDLVIATLLGAEEFAFGTGALVAIGCDMARQCHLDTCPTGIATQREDLRAKFTGTPELVARYFLRLAEDLRVELAAVGARSVGELVGEGRRYLAETRASTIDLRALTAVPRWEATPERRAHPERAGRTVDRGLASPLEHRLVAALGGQGALTASGLRLTTAERSFGAGLAGAVERGELRGPVRLELRGSAGQSFGAFASDRVALTLDGSANDYVGKGLSGGIITVRPDPATAAAATGALSLVGNTCLYGATGGRLHVVGRAGMRFAVRNSGAEAVVEGVGPHACEYMTGGAVVVLGPVGQNFGAGMTGGRAYLWDPGARHLAALNGASVRAVRLSDAVRGRPNGEALAAEFRRLVSAHADAGSALAARLLAERTAPEDDTWLVEPLPDPATAAASAVPATTEASAQPAAPEVAVARPGRAAEVAGGAGDGRERRPSAAAP